MRPLKGVFGGRSRTRTYDPLIKSQLLYQLSYAPLPRAAHRPCGERSIYQSGPGLSTLLAERLLALLAHRRDEHDHQRQNGGDQEIAAVRPLEEHHRVA